MSPPRTRKTTSARTAAKRRRASVAPLTHRGELLYAMLRIRCFEERCVELYSATTIRGFVHLYIGEEAVAVGVNQALTDDDAVVATYREHGHALSRGVPAEAVMAEMYGKVTGCSRGRGGSMHMFDVSRRFYGGSAIVGGGLPLAAGLALADKMTGRSRAAAWIIAQHADEHREFQEHALTVLRDAVQTGEAEQWQLACLTDRCLVRRGEPQLYGTQYLDGQPRPIADPDQLDERRAAAGLGPHVEYDAQMHRA